MTRPIGDRIEQVCRIVEQNQPCTVAQVAAKTDGMEEDHARKYLSRGAKWGLLVQSEEFRGRRTLIYRTAIGWEDQIRRLRGIEEDGPLQRGLRTTIANTTVKGAIARRTALERVWG